MLIDFFVISFLDEPYVCYRLRSAYTQIRNKDLPFFRFVLFSLCIFRIYSNPRGKSRSSWKVENLDFPPLTKIECANFGPHIDFATICKSN